MKRRKAEHGTKPSERKAHVVAGDAKARNLNRVRRIEGQVRGIQKMIEDDRYCGDIITQIQAAQEALRSVTSELLRNHVKHCVRHALAGSDDTANASIDELVKLVERSGS